MLKKEEQECVIYAKDLFNDFYTEQRILQAKKDILDRQKMDVEYSRGGILIDRGYHCRSMAYDLYITNVKRGKLLKKAPRKAPDYAYYYKDDILTLASKYPNQKNEMIEHIQWNGNVESSILLTPTLSKAEWPKICVATLNQNETLEKNTMCTFFMDDQEIRGFDLCAEKYIYDGCLKECRLIYVSAMEMCKMVYLRSAEIQYTYHENGEPRGYFLDSHTGYCTGTEYPLPEPVKAMMNQKIKHP